MINGKKDFASGDTPISNSHRFVAMGMAGVIGLFAFHIYKNYDPTQSTTQVFGVQLKLGENESGENEGKSSESGEHGEEDDDED